MFDSLQTHGFIRVAVGLPPVRVADPAFNATATLDLARQAAGRQAALIVFPELGLCAYSSEDLVQQDALLDASLAALADIVRASAELAPVLVVGLPLRHDGRLLNTAAVVHRGRILGIVPKSYLPNYREYAERRQFAPAAQVRTDRIRLAGQDAPLGTDLLFTAAGRDDLCLAVEICEDLWVPLPPSTLAALAGATLLANLSASNAAVGKAEYRRALCANQSARCVAAYLYAGAGPGESTTDLAWDGHGLICENNDVLAESTLFAPAPQLLVADVDLERLRQDRMRMNTFADCEERTRSQRPPARVIEFAWDDGGASAPLLRTVERFPFVPADPERRDTRCREAIAIQVQGLTTRLATSGLRHVVVGVSGGLDSTQALLVAARAFDALGRPRTDIIACTLPGFATGERTLANARALMKALGVRALEIDIRPAARRMLADIEHPAAAGEPVHDPTFENVQAGERTSLLFRLANRHGGLVLGTSDLSELALGWTTYGVGDHMSHYNVNASVPKTLIRHLIAWTLRQGEFGDAAAAPLSSILETAISPELVPGTTSGGDPAQSTEAVIGPYALQDFHLYYITRFGFRPSKVAFLATQAWGDVERGGWPDLVPPAERRAWSRAEIRAWLEVFLTRFFGASQFKRSCVPNAPKVGSGGSLSPRGDWRAPSDAGAAVWLDELRRNVP